MSYSDSVMLVVICNLGIVYYNGQWHVRIISELRRKPVKAIKPTDE